MKSEGDFRKFSTGAVRDTATKKPMIHLISPFFLQDLGEHLRFACQDRKPKPYPMRNWEQGMPFSETLGSGLRHLIAELAGDKSEDHMAALGFCSMCIAHYRHEIAAGRMDPVLDDLPHYPDKKMLLCGDHVEPVSDGTPEILQCRSCGKEFPGFDLVNIKSPDLLCRECWVESNLFCRECGSVKLYLVDGLCANCRTKKGVLPTFYITGPMRGIPQFNFPLFDKVTKRAREKGYSVISPAELDREKGIDPTIDSFNIEQAIEADPNLIQTIVARDCKVITGLKKERGDGLILLPGWPNSTGARAEVALALWLGLQFRECGKFENLLPQVIEKELFYQEELD